MANKSDKSFRDRAKFATKAVLSVMFGVHPRTLDRQEQRDPVGHPKPVVIGKNTRKYEIQQMIEYYQRRGDRQ